MITPPFWTKLQQRVDFIVDGQWSEKVIMIPWAKGTKVYIPGEEGPDLSRDILETKGIYVTPGSKLVGESGRSTGGSGGGFNTQLLEAECWLSITQDDLGGGLADWETYDRIYFPQRDLMYSFNYAELSATYRPNIHLIRVDDTLVGQGIPPTSLVPTLPNQLWFDLLSLSFWRADDNNNWVKVIV